MSRRHDNTMMPINLIRLRLVQEVEVPDIELIGARLLHHKYYLTVYNGIASDCGDTWMCTLTEIDGKRDNVWRVGPSLRSALLAILKKAIEDE